MRISKSELAEMVEVKLKETKNPSSKERIDAVIESITEVLERGDSISFNNFGTFEVKERIVKKKCSNEEETEETSIKKSVSFKISKVFQDQLNPEN